LTISDARPRPVPLDDPVSCEALQAHVPSQSLYDAQRARCAIVIAEKHTLIDRTDGSGGEK